MPLIQWVLDVATVVVLIACACTVWAGRRVRRELDRAIADHLAVKKLYEDMLRARGESPHEGDVTAPQRE